MGIIIRQSIKGTIANYIGIAVGFVTTFFMLTNYLTTAEVGLTRVLVDAGTLFSSFALLGTGSSIIRFFPYFKDEEQKNHGIFFWSLIIPLIGFALFILCFFICKGLIIRTFSENSPLFVNYVYYILPLAFFMVYLYVFECNATILMRVAVPKFIREVVIRVLLLAGYILFGHGIINLDGLVIFFCATYGIAAALNFIYLISTQKISFKPDWKYITKDLRKEFIYYTLFLITAALVTNVLPTLSSFFVTAQMGLAFTGIYAIATYIAAVIEVPYRSLSAIVNPQISVAIKEQDIPKATSLCQKVALNQFLAGATIFLIIWINIDLLFQILPNGEQYATGKWVVFILGLTRLMISSFGIGGAPLGYSKFYYFSLLFTLVLMISSIFLNYYLIPIYGINGAAFATLLSNFVYYVLSLWFVQKKIGTTPFSWNLLKVLALIAIMTALNYGFTYINGYIFRNPTIVMAVVEAVLRTGIVCISGLIMLYFGRVSPEINVMIDKAIAKVRH